jgi:hypothetical protein
MRTVNRTVVFAVGLLFVLGCGSPTAPSTGAKSPVSPDKKAAVQAPAKASETKAAPAKPAAPSPATPKPQAPPAKPQPPVAKSQPPKPDVNVVKSWDYTEIEPEKWGNVKFPGNVRQKWQDGAAFTMWESGIGPDFRSVGMKASDFSAIRVAVKAFRTKDGQKKTRVPIKYLTALWASPSGAKVKQPFAKDHSLAFKPVDPQNTLEWTADLKGAPKWKGQIERLAIAIELPEKLKKNADDRYLLVVQRVEFLK